VGRTGTAVGVAEGDEETKVDGKVDGTKVDGKVDGCSVGRADGSPYVLSINIEDDDSFDSCLYLSIRMLRPTLFLRLESNSFVKPG